MNLSQWKRAWVASGIFFLFGALPSRGADLAALKSLFYTHYNELYTPRFCGQNIERFLRLADQRAIDIRGASVLRIESFSFFQTSSFFGRGSPDRRQNLGTFHFILVAEGHVFDFDLHVPVVLREPEYLRLQLTPNALISSPISGLTHPKFDAHLELSNLELQVFDAMAFISNRGVRPHWVGRLDQRQDIDAILRIDRPALVQNVQNRVRLP